MNIASAVQVVLLYRRNQFNLHTWNIPPARLSEGLKLTVSSSLTLSTAITLIRLSLCCFYLRLHVRSGTKYYRRSIVVVMSMVVLLQCSLLIATLLQCM